MKRYQIRTEENMKHHDSAVGKVHMKYGGNVRLEGDTEKDVFFLSALFAKLRGRRVHVIVFVEETTNNVDA
jgi:hypothetical protein